MKRQLKAAFREEVREILTENWGYKTVALLITLTLWLTILGRRDFLITKNLPVEFLVDPKLKIVSQTVDSVKLQISGPRGVLRGISAQVELQALIITVPESRSGFVDVEFPVDALKLPSGAKLVSVRPSKIRLELLKKP